MVQTMDGGISHTWGLCTSLLCRLLALGGPWGGSRFSHLWMEPATSGAARKTDSVTRVGHT